MATVADAPLSSLFPTYTQARSAVTTVHAKLGSPGYYSSTAHPMRRRGGKSEWTPPMSKQPLVTTAHPMSHGELRSRSVRMNRGAAA
jgi:hypothetical protein